MLGLVVRHRSVFCRRDLQYGPIPQVGGIEPAPILLQHIGICKMLRHILVSFNEVGNEAVT